MTDRIDAISIAKKEIRDTLQYLHDTTGVVPKTVTFTLLADPNVDDSLGYHKVLINELTIDGSL